MTRLAALCLVVGSLSAPMLAVAPGWRTLPTVTHLDPHAVIRSR